MVETLLSLIAQKEKQYDPLIIAIDGRCGSGKTTLAALLQEKLGCTVIHMDDFFLRPEQRTQKRLQTPGENIDHERFLSEVLQNIVKENTFTYKPFDCSKGALGGEKEVRVNKIVVIEGSYALHPALLPHYHIKVFSDIDPDTQMRRIVKRNPFTVEMFKNKWIPLEEAYFKANSIREKCDIIIKEAVKKQHRPQTREIKGLTALNHNKTI